MLDASSPKIEALWMSDLYLTSQDLNVYEAVLNDAMAEMERSVPFDDPRARKAALLRMASSLLRRAMAGERDPAALKRVALGTYAVRDYLGRRSA